MTLIKKVNKPTDIHRSTKYLDMIYDRETKEFDIYRKDRKTGEVRHIKLLKAEAGTIQRFIFSMFQKPPLKKVRR